MLECPWMKCFAVLYTNIDEVFFDHIMTGRFRDPRLVNTGPLTTFFSYFNFAQLLFKTLLTFFETINSLIRWPLSVSKQLISGLCQIFDLIT